MRHPLAALALVAVSPAVALACPVCFGAADSALFDGARLGVLVLLGITTAVLAGFAAFMVYLVRQARRHAAALPEAGAPPRGAAAV
ncbi:MAG TPA: hypothetical protein VNI83_09705 [Vicinamibacterales bacterium]|nr:hypothetical protein [Vicinamibacterales bacterium]